MGKLSAGEPPRKRGPKESRGVVVDRIVEVARSSFAEQGYDGTSMRSVAIAAGVDPRLVGYYFGSKQALLEACLVPPPGFVENVAAVASSEPALRGEALVRSLLGTWRDPQSAVVLRSIILIAAQHPLALERLRLIVSGSLIGAVATNLDDQERMLRGGLVATQLLGLAMTRYVWRLEPIASLPDEDVVACLAPTVQRYLTGELRPGY
jgi:AcrR family transcriptional regulator